MRAPQRLASAVGGLHLDEPALRSPVVARRLDGGAEGDVRQHAELLSRGGRLPLDMLIVSDGKLPELAAALPTVRA